MLKDPARTITRGRAPAVEINRSDIRSLVKAQLRILQNQLRGMATNYPDRMSRYHLQDLSDRIKEALDPQ